MPKRRKKWVNVSLTAICVFTIGWLSGCAEMPNELPHRATGLVAENLKLPAQFKRADGSLETIMLDAQVIRPDDDLPHPLLVFNHDYPYRPDDIYADFMRLATVEYARYGLVTLAFTRRGIGLSEGEVTQGVDVCSAQEILRFERESAEDILEAIRLISQKSYVEKSKIINVGGGAGGLQAVTFAMYNPGVLTAAINFDGTMRKRSEKKNCSRNSLVDSISKMGNIPAIPTLWLYSTNRKDSERNGQAMVHAFIENGGRAEFSVLPPVMPGDRFPFESGSSTWSRYINPFLRNLGIQTLDSPIAANRIRIIYGANKN